MGFASTFNTSHQQHLSHTRSSLPQGFRGLSSTPTMQHTLGAFLLYTTTAVGLLHTVHRCVMPPSHSSQCMPSLQIPSAFRLVQLCWCEQQAAQRVPAPAKARALALA